MGWVTLSGRRAVVAAAAAAVLAVTVPPPLLGADDIRIAIDRGRVTLVATDAPLADVLAVWSRAGGTRFVGAEALDRELVTLRLVDSPEAAAIQLLLRSAAGYVAAPHRDPASPSRYGLVTILAPRRAPAAQSTRTTNAAPESNGTAPRTAPSVPAPPALVAMEELQRLLDAADPGGADAGDRTPPELPVRTTPLPGLGALPAAGAERPRNP